VISGHGWDFTVLGLGNQGHWWLLCSIQVSLFSFGGTGHQRPEKNTKRDPRSELINLSFVFIHYPQKKELKMNIFLSILELTSGRHNTLFGKYQDLKGLTSECNMKSKYEQTVYLFIFKLHYLYFFWKHCSNLPERDFMWQCQLE